MRQHDKVALQVNDQESVVAHHKDEWHDDHEGEEIRMLKRQAAKRGVQLREPKMKMSIHATASSPRQLTTHLRATCQELF